jgi:hypothetical protein
MLEGIPIEKVVYLAFKTSTGAVSDFIQKYLKVNPRAEWVLSRQNSQRDLLTSLMHNMPSLS